MLSNQQTADNTDKSNATDIIQLPMPTTSLTTLKPIGLL